MSVHHDTPVTGRLPQSFAYVDDVVTLGLLTHMGKKEVDFDRSVEQSLPTTGTCLLLLWFLHQMVRSWLQFQRTFLAIPVSRHN